MTDRILVGDDVIYAANDEHIRGVVLNIFRGTFDPTQPHLDVAHVNWMLRYDEDDKRPPQYVDLKHLRHPLQYKTGRH